MAHFSIDFTKCCPRWKKGDKETKEGSERARSSSSFPINNVSTDIIGPRGVVDTEVDDLVDGKQLKMHFTELVRVASDWAVIAELIVSGNSCG